MEIKIPSEGLELITKALSIHTPILFEASCMDHGQGASMILRSDEHKTLFNESNFDIGFWFFESYWELCELEGFYWAGDGGYEIYEFNGVIVMDVEFGKGYFSECDSPFEQNFFNDISSRINTYLEAKDPDTPYDQWDTEISVNLQCSLTKGITVSESAIFSEDFEDPQKKIDEQVASDVALLVTNEMNYAANEWLESLTESVVEANLSLFGDKAFIENLPSDFELSYSAICRYQLIPKQDLEP